MDTKIREIIKRQCGVDFKEAYGYDKCSDELNIYNDLGLDSLDCIELTMTFEEEYGLEIPDDDAEAWKTVGDIITYLKEKEKSN